MSKDKHALFNLIIGTSLALVAGIYYSEIPTVALVVMGTAATALIYRECWKLGRN